MEDSKYEAWQKFCEESDRQVADFNAKPQKHCPFCGGEAEAHWNYDGDYNPHFVIECKSCEARVKTYRFDEAVKMWNMRIEVAHDREIKALEWKIENFAKVVECKDREIKAKDAEVAELREKWHEALNIADSVEKCASIERQTEAMLKKNEVIAGLRKQIAELRECVRQAYTDVCLKCVRNERIIVCSRGRECENVKRWRKALEGGNNEVE